LRLPNFARLRLAARTASRRLRLPNFARQFVRSPLGFASLRGLRPCWLVFSDFAHLRLAARTASPRLRRRSFVAVRV